MRKVAEELRCAWECQVAREVCRGKDPEGMKDPAAALVAKAAHAEMEALTTELGAASRTLEPGTVS